MATKKEPPDTTPTPIKAGMPPELSEEQRAAIMAKQQRRATEHAVLQQRFAEVEVERAIAVAERDQLVQQLQQLQRQNVTLQEEIEVLKNPTKPEPVDKTPDETEGDGKEG